MKILHIINSLDTGGAEKLLTDLAIGMKKQGHEVGIVALYDIDFALKRVVENAGIGVTSLASRNRDIYSPTFIFKLRKYIGSADIIHVHLFPAQYWAALAKLLSSSKAVLVTTEHSTFNKRAQYALTSWIDKKIYGIYDGIACISEATAQFMRNRMPARMPVKVIANGIDIPSDKQLATAPPRASQYLPELPDDAFVMLQVARFGEQKDQATVVKSLQHLPKQVHAVFAGDGKGLQPCKALAERLGISDRAHFLGNRNDIPQLWRIADIGVMSSLWEGFGLAAAEGMSYAKPVIASNVPGLSVVIGRTDMLFEVGNARQLAERVMSFYSSPELIKTIGQECRQRAARYGIGNTINEYLAFYSELLNTARN